MQTWKAEKPKGHSGPGRYGHTANVYKNSMVIHGGEAEYNEKMKKRECLNDFY